jgi:hypothetical protein
MLTNKTLVDMAYIPLYQFKYGELYTGGFQIGTKRQKTINKYFYMGASKL